MIESRRQTTPFDELDRAEIARRYGRAAAYREEDEESTAFWLRLTALLFIVALLALFTTYTLAQVTTRASAERIIGRAIPEITDFDSTFAGHYDELRTAANSSPGSATSLMLTGYPVRVTLAPNEVKNESPAELRHTLLIRTADVIYDHGINAFSADGRPVKLGSNGILSGPWAFKTALSILNPSVHKQFQQGARVAAIVCAVLALCLGVLGRQYNRIVMYGVAVFVAAVPGLAVAALIWLLVQVVFGSSSDPLVAGTSDITRDVAWYVILSYLVFAALGAALFILGMIVERVGLIVAVQRDPARNREYRAPS